MKKLTVSQAEALIQKIYLCLMQNPDFGFGEMGECRDEAERIVFEWATENGIQLPEDENDVQLAEVEEDRPKTMKVIIPKIAQHEGYPGNAIEVEISIYCPVCGRERGKPFDTISYDGSRRLIVHGWHNPCGHVDKYSSVRDEVGLTK